MVNFEKSPKSLCDDIFWAQEAAERNTPPAIMLRSVSVAAAVASAAAFTAPALPGRVSTREYPEPCPGRAAPFLSRALSCVLLRPSSALAGGVLVMRSAARRTDACAEALVQRCLHGASSESPRPAAACLASRRGGTSVRSGAGGSRLASASAGAVADRCEGARPWSEHGRGQHLQAWCGALQVHAPAATGTSKPGGEGGGSVTSARGEDIATCVWSARSLCAVFSVSGGVFRSGEEVVVY